MFWSELPSDVRISHDSDEDDALPDTNSLHRIISSKIRKRKPVSSCFILLSLNLNSFNSEKGENVLREASFLTLLQ